MDLSLISKYRNELFGLSIISIIIYHFCEDYFYAYQAGEVAKNILILGYYHGISSVGVEIFLLLSGFGLYYSFSKDDDLRTFYLKRAKKLLIPYIPIGIVLWGVLDFWLIQMESELLLKILLSFQFTQMVSEA